MVFSPRTCRGRTLAIVALLSLASAAVAAPHGFHYLNAADFSPETLLPAPPQPGSVQSRAELAEVRAMIAGASPERLAQARWDQDHETPALFDQTLGIKLEDHPLTWALLREVQDESDAAASLNKAFFHRMRPWGLDPSLPSCERAPEHKPTNSYPSGHAALGYATGYVLARMLEGRSAAILARAADYAASREYCGVHFASDIEASHALGLLVATKLLADPAFAAKVVAARQELASAQLPGV